MVTDNSLQDQKAFCEVKNCSDIIKAKATVAINLIVEEPSIYYMIWLRNFLVKFFGLYDERL